MLPSLLRLSTLLLVSAVSAAGQLVSGDWGYTNVSQGSPPTNVTIAVITNYIGAPGIATVPGVIGTNPVRIVGNVEVSYSIDPQSRLTGIVLPDSVTSISSNAFYKSTNLSSVTFGSGIQAIGYAAFGESGLTSVTVPDSVSSLGDYAFYKTPRLTNAVLGSGITNVSYQAFFECTNLRSVTLPAGLKNISRYAFMRCRALTNAAIPHGVNNVDDYAFAHCWSLPAVVIPDTVSRIGREAFKECLAMTNLVLGAGLTNTTNGTFAYCQSLVSVTIPPGVTNIAGGLFNDCTSLESIILGPGVKSVGDVSLGFCPALRSVLFTGNAPTLSGTTGAVFTNSTNVTVFALPGTTGWGSAFAGRPTMLFLPQAKLATVSSSVFNFTWTGTGSIPMNVQRRDSLVAGSWDTLATGITNGFFADTNPPVGAAYYRSVLH